MADKQVERKHLFGTSERSDFIVNLSDAGTKKLCALYCIIAMLLIEAAALPYYLTKNIVDYTEGVMGVEIKHYISEKVIYWSVVIMFGIGILGLCVMLIGQMKKQISLKDNKALLWLGGVTAMSLVSALAAEDVASSMTGYLDRAEGMLTLVGYYGFFAAAFTVTAENWRRRVLGVAVGVGAVNAVIGILQVVPALRGKIPNWFDMLNTDFTLGIDMPAANGLAMTPHALAALLTITFGAAIISAAFADSVLLKLLSAASAVLMAVAGVFTRTTTALVGIGTAALLALVAAVIYALKGKPDDEEAELPRKGIILGALCSVVLAGAAVGVLAATDNLKLQDEEVIRTDSIRMLMLLRKEDQDTWVYPYLWDDGLYIAEQNILLGTGPDNWETISKAGASIDRTYNEYIDTAMQRGFVTLVLYGIFLIISVVKALKAYAGFVKGRYGWSAAAVMSAVIAYSVQAMFNISTLTSTPFFFIFVGLAWSYTARRERTSKK